MVDRNMLFSAPMVRALLAGTKTQARWIIKPQPSEIVTSAGVMSRSDFGVLDEWTWLSGYPRDCNTWGYEGDFKIGRKAGDRVWVRETWKPHSTFAGWKPRDVPQSKVFYSADDRYAPSNTPWVPSIFMPRWASRITLDVTEVRVERLQDISEEDAIAEGCRPIQGSTGPNFFSVYISGGSLNAPTALETYQILWNVINGDGAWGANPFVSVTTFRVTLRNIDRIAS